MVSLSPINEAFKIYSEFGPKMAISREERLSKAFKRVPKDTIHQWLEEFSRVNECIWKCAEAGAERCHSKQELSDLFLSSFSWMDQNSVTTAIFLSNYYAAHEGY